MDRSPDEALAHFRQKLDLPTEYFDQVLGQAHAKGFTVAGATRAELVGDLRAAVDAAIEGGESIGAFRKRFDTIVAEHGWSYKGRRGWRSRVIYDTNRRTASMAGRWAQIQRTKARRPYLQYLTVGDSRVRPEHAAWNGTVLPADDEWWATHYPPNGWGCRCTIRTLSDRDLERRGLEVDQSPSVELEERVNTTSGEIYGDYPKGIDTGWAYNVGQAWLGPDIALGEAIMGLPVALRNAALANAATLTPRLQATYKPWAESYLGADRARREIRTVGYLTPELITALAAHGVKPTTAVITIIDRELIHLLRDAKRDRQVPLDLLLNLPERLHQASRVLWDKKQPALLFVFNARDSERAKFVIRVGYRTKVQTDDGRRVKIKTNEVVTAGMVQERNLNPGTYETLLEGGD